MLSVHALVKEVKHMKKKQKVGGFFAVLGLLILGAMLVPAVSAGQTVGTVGSDLPALLSGQQNLTVVEFIIKDEKDSTMFLWLDAEQSPQPIKDLCTNLDKDLNDLKTQDIAVKSVIVTAVSKENRVSYALNLATGMFEKLETPDYSVDKLIDEQADAANSDMGLILRTDYPPTNTSGKSQVSGNVYYSWANSVSNPSGTYYAFMSATTRVQKYNPTWHTWSNYVVSSSTANDVTSRFADATATYSSGYYHALGDFQGTYYSGGQYAYSGIDGGYFTIA
jgi:hypothetical protein